MNVADKKEFRIMVREEIGAALVPVNTRLDGMDNRLDRIEDAVVIISKKLLAPDEQPRLVHKPS